MAERVEYVLRSADGEEWKAYETEAVARLRLPMLNDALPENAPFTLWERIIIERALTK